MTDTPRWDLAAAESAVASLDLAREVGAAVGVPAVVLDPSPTDPDDRWDAVLGQLAPLAVVTVAEWGRADVIGPVDELVAAIIARPQAAATTAVHLRTLPGEPLAALHQESLAYATLQGGAEHAAWLASQGRRTRNDDAPRVTLTDEPDLTITLTRSRLHNLLDRRGRDELAEAFRAAALIAPGRPIRWRADGPSFCAGGDPAEFGSVTDPATAHLIRMASSPGPAVLAVADRLSVDVHGACVGAGIELAAMASSVVAHPDTRFRLPELTMGLMPGVGGTWSIGRRIGRRLLLQWLLLDLEIDVDTALAWRLIDVVATSDESA
ncbi:MAG: enoyl-CoA hydratase/isomerase family protein [Actinobacteria bacterium]|jgi:enoyl-CoA hydratase/carnithine racemase|nr:enoyl-CoA hydratase/isomerase family protein [Actinomycetota bacterium]